MGGFLEVSLEKSLKEFSERITVDSLTKSLKKLSEEYQEKFLKELAEDFLMKNICTTFEDIPGNVLRASLEELLNMSL